MGGVPEIKSFDSFDDLKTGLAELLGAEVSLFVVQGQHHQISEGPFHYLITSDGERRALFDVPSPEDAVPAEDGYVGNLPDDEEGSDEEEDAEHTEEDEDEDDEPGSDSTGDDEESPYGDDEPDLTIHNPG